MLYTEKEGEFIIKANFFMMFLGIMIGLTTGFLIINNEIEVTTSIFLIVFLILAVLMLIALLYKNYKVKLQENNQDD
ncbi:hypothetical protein LSPH24S_03988 [Lysinibacillus sphaericus]